MSLAVALQANPRPDLIEDAATLNDAAGQLPEAAHAVLLTPQVFKERPGSRFHGCKFDEYFPNAGHPGLLRANRTSIGSIERWLTREFDVEGLKVRTRGLTDNDHSLQ